MTLEFYWNFSQVLRRIRSHQDIIILGNFSARVGSRSNDDVVRKYGKNMINDSGEDLIEF